MHGGLRNWDFGAVYFEWPYCMIRLVGYRSEAIGMLLSGECCMMKLLIGLPWVSRVFVVQGR